MRRGLLWGSGMAVQLAALGATALPPFTPGLGAPEWHHTASLVGVAVAAALVWRPLTRDRAFAGQGVLVTTALALVSAFLLLYLKDDLKASGLKDWAKWWHVAWSWASIAFLVGHTWVNRAGLVRAARRLTKGAGAATANVGPYALVVAAIPLTWSAWGAAAIQDPNYILWTHWTWLAFLVPSYAAWATVTLRGSWLHRPPLLRPRAARDFASAHLLPIAILANVTGLPLVYLATKDTPLKYVAKWWHTWPSIAMAILVFAHVVTYLAGVKGHWKAAKGAGGDDVLQGDAG